MARCTNCDVKWKAKDIWLLGCSKKGRKCAHCGQKQYISAESQKRLTAGYVSLIFVPFLFHRLQLSDKDDA